MNPLRPFPPLHQPSRASLYTIKNDASEFDLQTTFNELTMISMNPPELPGKEKLALLPKISLNEDDSKEENLVDVLSEIKSLKNTLRYISLNPVECQSGKSSDPNGKGSNLNKSPHNNSIDKQVFIRPTQEVLNGDKTFWMVKGIGQSKRIRLNLDAPVLVTIFTTDSNSSNLSQQLLVAIERKCLSLYQIDQNQIYLKDFDSISLGKKLNCVEIKHVRSLQDDKDYILVFGNERDSKQDYFKCLVYEITNMQLIFVKKAVLLKGQVNSPTILFQTYPKNEKQSFCLVCGGCYDNRNSFYSCGWQIDLHLLLSPWLTYPTELTKEAPFDSRRQNILSGKAIKYNDFWYLFCTETQSISQMKLDYQHGIQLEMIHLTTYALELKEKIYFSEDNLFFGLKRNLKLVMLNKELQFREKDFLEIVGRFDSY